MRVLFLLLVLLFPNLPAIKAKRRTNEEQKSVVFVHTAIIDTVAGSVDQDMTVLIVGNHIVDVAHAGMVKIPTTAQVVDGSGKFLMPGLLDMHVHIFNQVSRRPANTWYFPLFIANGITSVREMWTKPTDIEQVREWRRLQAQGTLLVPRIAAVGTLVDGPPGAQTTSIGNALPGPAAHIVTTPDEAREFVRQVKTAGIDFVKTYSSLSRELYLAIADEAKKVGIPFAGHVPFAVDALEASSVGQRSMEHLNQMLESVSSRRQELLQVSGRDWSTKHEQLMLDTFDEERFKKLVVAPERNDTWQVPTLVNAQLYAFQRNRRTIWDDERLRYVPDQEVRTWKQLFSEREREPSVEDKKIRTRLWQRQLDVVRRMHKSGVPFMAGTDLGTAHIYPGFSLHDELALFVQAGLTPGEALKTATYNPAKFLGMLEHLGTVEKYKLADLVLLDANPLEDIHNTQKIRAVVLNGRYLDRSALDELLAEAEANAKESSRR